MPNRVVGGAPILIFCGFDRQRVAILLIGGNKIGRNNFYTRLIPEADQ